MTATKKADYLAFTNRGEVPINAFKLLGASSKRNDSSKIGYFGTGLKYALAVFLREGVDFKIYSGLKEVKIGTRKTKFFDQDINVITVNGEKTSITVEAGINWEPWFAIREIYSNNLDENGTMSLSTTPKPEAGLTKIYVKKDEKLGSLIDNWSSYFSNTRTMLSSNDEYSVLQKNDHNYLTVFRRGIRAYVNRTPSLFDYDIQNLKINESRVAESDGMARQRCAEALASSTNKEVVSRFIECRDDNFIERDSDFWTYLFDDWNAKYSFSDVWFELLKHGRIVPAENAGFYGVTTNTIILPEKLCRQLFKKFGNELTIMGTTREAYIITKQSTTFLAPAMEQLNKVGYGYPMSKIKIAKFKDKDILGMADKGRVLISEQVKLPSHSSDILPILLEEIVHAKTGYSDNTRSLQDHVFKMCAALIESYKVPKKTA